MYSQCIAGWTKNVSHRECVCERDSVCVREIKSMRERDSV